MKKIKLITHNSNLFLQAIPRAFGEFFELKSAKDTSELLDEKRIFISWGGWKKNPTQSVFNQRKALGLPSIIMERGALTNSLILDGTGFNYDSKLYDFEHWKDRLDRCDLDDLRRSAQSLLKGRDALEYQGSEPVPKTPRMSGTVFVPLQLETDFVIKHYAGWAGSVQGFFEKIERAAAENMDMNFLVKKHPLSKIKLGSALPNINFVDNCHYKDCMKVADVVATVNSGVGAQAACLGKHTIVCGDAFYEHVPSVVKAEGDVDLSLALRMGPPANAKDFGAAFYSYLGHIYSNAELTKNESVRFLNATSGCDIKSLAINFSPSHRVGIN